MGGSSKQVIGYRYFTNFLLFIGNPIEKVLGINFDKRGWLSPFVDEDGNALAQGVIDSPTLYGENEGGVAGVAHVQYGRDDQEVLPFYKDYMVSLELPASAYPFQSYLAFTGLGQVNTGNGWIDGALGALAGHMNEAFYVGNSGYMKEMLLWPKRIHVRNDGRAQWYDIKAEVAKEKQGGSEYLPEQVIRSTILDGRELDWTAFSYGDGYLYGSGSVEYTYNLTGPSAVFELRQEFGFWGGRSGKVEFSLPDKSVTLLRRDQTASGGDHYFYLLKLPPKTTSFKVFISWGEQKSTNPDPWTFGSIMNALHTSDLVLRPEIIYSGDINPIHKIREILTDDTAMNKPESSVNNDNFIKAADRIFDEELGISWSITEKSCMDAINELCYHIEAGIRVNRQTGLYEMILFRDNWFEESEIHAIEESKIKSMQYEVTNADEVINQVNVNYYDRANIKNSSFSISENGLIQTLGRVNAETLDFPYFMNMRNAEIVANWKLKQLSTGAFKGSFTTGWREARKWNRYDLIRLPWSKRWTGAILVRVMSINLGGPTNNEVTIEYIEVVPATGMINTTIVIDDPIDTKPQAPQPCNAKVFELPYFEAVQAFGERNVNTEIIDNPELGYLCVIAEKPQNNSLNAALYVDSSNGFDRVATVNYCETAYLDQPIDRINSSFVLKNVGNIASARLGSQIFINDEIMVYQSYDAETKVLTVKRGAFDIIPQNHNINSILYFADDFVAVDQTLYVDSEIVDAKVLTTTPSGVLALVDAVNHEVVFNSRAIRPYPPANVKINGIFMPTYIDGGLQITWANRNRLQQTGGEILGYFEGSVSLEPNTQTILTIIEYGEDDAELSTQNANVTAVNNFILSDAGMSIGVRKIKVVLKTVRDGFECLNPFEHTILVLNLVPPTNVNFEVIEI